MTDQTPSDDELLSSYLDGEATPEEVARIEADPALRARAEDLRAAANLVATPVEALRTADLDQLIGKALDASATSETVIDMRAAARRKQRFQQRLVGVAAAVLVVAVAVPALIAITGSSDSDTSAGVDNTSADADSGDDTGGDDGDDSGAGDMSFSDAADDSADDGDDGDDGDMAEQEMAEEEMVEEAEAVQSEATEREDAPGADAEGLFEGDDAAAPTEATRQSLLDAGYDLLDGAEIGTYESSEALLARQSEKWAEFAQSRAGATTGGASDEDLATLQELATLTPCGLDVLDFAGWPSVSIDIGQAIIEGESVTIAVVEFADDRLALLLGAAEPDCIVTEIGELEE